MSSLTKRDEVNLHCLKEIISQRPTSSLLSEMKAAYLTQKTPPKNFVISKMTWAVCPVL